MKPRWPTSCGALLCLLTCPVAVHAQLGLPPVPILPNLPSLPAVSNAAAVGSLTSRVDPRDLSALRMLRVRELLRANRRVLEPDAAGEAIVRGEVLVLSPSERTLDRLRELGFAVVRETVLEGLGVRLVVLHGPRNRSTVRSLRLLREVDAAGVEDFNHVYLGTGLERSYASAMTAVAAEPIAASQPRVRIGLVDGGVDELHPVFHGGLIHHSGCAGPPVPSTHGTAVASIMVGGSDIFTGVDPGSELFAADVYCGSASGGAVEALAAALAWFVRERVAVINVSLVGPRNAVLESVIRLVLERGHIVVAAVGNDGPAAAPLYPAAFAGVVGVTAVDARQRVLLEANRGPQVVFAAPGADMAAASPPDGYVAVRGTSFAAPIVAGLLARELLEPDPMAAARAVRFLAGRAIDLGAPGRDAVYGFGLVGAEFRVEPKRVTGRHGPGPDCGEPCERSPTR